MAKKRASTSQSPDSGPGQGGKQRGRPKSAQPKPVTPIFLTIRANAAWQAWFGRLSDALLKDKGLSIKLDRTDAFDIVVTKVAADLGLPEPPSRY